MATTALTLDSFPFVGTTPGGGRAILKGLDGWLSAGFRRAREARTGRHGSYSSTGLRAPLEVTLKGYVFYDTAADCAAERLEIKALGASGLPVELAVTDALAALAVDVDVDEIEVTVMNDRMLSYEITVVANDPFVRAATANSPVTVGATSSNTVPNDGTRAADLLVTLTSGGTVVLTAGGLTLTTTALPSGAVIDTGACTVTSSGGEVNDLFSAVVPGSQWPAVPAGGGSVAQAGTANLSVVTYDTY